MPGNNRNRKRCKAAGTYCRAARKKIPRLTRRKALPKILVDEILPARRKISFVRSSANAEAPVMESPTRTATVPTTEQAKTETRVEVVSDTCTIITYHEGDAATAVDEHFGRSLAHLEVSMPPVHHPQEPAAMVQVALQATIPPPPPVIEVLDTSTAFRVEHGALEESVLFEVCDMHFAPARAPSAPPVEQESAQPEWLDILFDFNDLL